jgi:hypothetical protein
MGPNFLDVDDDGDGYGTKTKLKGPTLPNNGSTANGYYPYSGAANDDPLTPNIDERQGIPATSQSFKTLDYTTAGRTEFILDKNYPVK